MNNKMKFNIGLFVIMLSSFVDCNLKHNDTVKLLEDMKLNMKKPNIQIILGSTRKGRMSEHIGAALKQIVNKRQDVVTEVVDLRDYPLNFLDDAIAPAQRKEILDPLVKKWSNKVSEADAFVIVCPVYNAGYPGVLKNALDVLYKEWDSKPVGFVTYSGGLSGGKTVAKQLREVSLALKMLPVDLEINIPQSYQVLDELGNFKNKNIEHEFNNIIDQIIVKLSL